MLFQQVIQKCWQLLLAFRSLKQGWLLSYQTIFLIGSYKNLIIIWGKYQAFLINTKRTNPPRAVFIAASLNQIGRIRQLQLFLFHQNHLQLLMYNHQVMKLYLQ